MSSTKRGAYKTHCVCKSLIFNENLCFRNPLLPLIAVKGCGDDTYCTQKCVVLESMVDVSDTNRKVYGVGVFSHVGPRFFLIFFATLVNL